MLEPLLQLRGEWRQAAAISVPASAGEIAELLDKAIDVLDANGQLDEESLVMATDMVCKAVPARADVTAILRMRLVRAAHDFAMVTAVEDAENQDAGGGAAFESEEALAAALFAGIGLEEEPEVVVPGPAVHSGRPRIDSRSLQRSLSTRVPVWRTRWFRWSRSLVGLSVVAGGVFYTSQHPPQLFQQNVVLPTQLLPVPSGPVAGTAGRTATGNSRDGTFVARAASCDNGQSSVDGISCSWPLDITVSGSFTVVVRWNVSAPLTVDLVDGAGRVLGPVAEAGDGKVTLAIATVPAGSYRLRVTNSSGRSDTIHFTATINGS